MTRTKKTKTKYNKRVNKNNFKNYYLKKTQRKPIKKYKTD